jgi:hypothetical protein
MATGGILYRNLSRQMEIPVYSPRRESNGVLNKQSAYAAF